MKSVITFVDGHPRIVFGTITELSPHEAIVVGGETGCWHLLTPLREPWSNLRDTLLHEIAHAILEPGHAHDAAWHAVAA